MVGWSVVQLTLSTRISVRLQKDSTPSMISSIVHKNNVRVCDCLHIISRYAKSQPSNLFLLVLTVEFHRAPKFYVAPKWITNVLRMLSVAAGNIPFAAHCVDHKDHCNSMLAQTKASSFQWFGVFALPAQHESLPDAVWLMTQGCGCGLAQRHIHAYFAQNPAWPLSQIALIWLSGIAYKLSSTNLSLKSLKPHGQQ